MLNFIVDFYSHEIGLAIEVDGDSHNEKVEYDTNREEALKAYGVRIIRFEDIDVKRRISWVLDEILHWVEEYKIQQK